MRTRPEQSPFVRRLLPPYSPLYPFRRAAMLLACALLLVTAVPAAQAAGLSAGARGAVAPEQPVAPEDVTAQISPRRVYVGDTATYTITIRKEGTERVDPPVLNVGDGLAAQFAGRSQSSSSTRRIVNGRPRVVTTIVTGFRYAVRPSGPGRYEIPPQSIQIGDRMVSTNAVTFVVVEPDAAADDVLELTLSATEIFEGQTVDFSLVWTIAESGGIDTFDFDTSSIPDGIEAALPAPRSTRSARGRDVAVRLFGSETSGVVATPAGGGDVTLVLRGQFTAQRSGDYPLDNISVVYGRSDRGRGVQQRYRVRAAPVLLSVKPLPSVGRPSGFEGVIGVYDIKAEAIPTRVRVGDPIELAVTVIGREPMRGVDDGPDLASIPGFSGGFRLSTDGWKFEPTRAGERRFTTTVRAASDEVEAIPPVPLAFFDPASATYRVAESDPIPLEIEAVREVTVADAVVSRSTDVVSASPSVMPGVAAEELRRTGTGVWAIETGPAVLASRRFDAVERIRSPAVLAALMAPVAMFVLAVIAVFARRRHDPDASRRRGALRAATRALRRSGPEAAIRRYIGDVFGRPAETLTVADCEALLGVHALRSSQALAELLARGEAVRYGGVAASAAASGAASGAAGRREERGASNRDVLAQLREVDRDVRRAL